MEDAYILRDNHELPEYKSKGYLYEHKRSGCRIYHVSNEDPENVFAFCFKTLPRDNTGVAHIIEHSVLCGSQNFPVKDPFLLLLKGSMKTFMNAFTFPDKTVYPAASTVEQDLFNLMRVYGDAVFSPLLKKEIFDQEGHRLEFDENGSLKLTGVVYNEMQGNYSSHDSIAGEWSYRSLFPDTPYRFDSGGEPSFIPNLSYDEFKQFHEINYHPSNAFVFLYGNIETRKYLDFLDSLFLADREAISTVNDVPEQPRWTSPVDFETFYPIGEEEGTKQKSSVTMNWLLSSVTDPYRVLSLELLSEILLGTSGAPLQKVLVESGLGEDLSSPTGIETELKELTFSAGLRGTDPDKKEQIEEVILNELRTLCEAGFDPEHVEGILRKVEFSNREIKGSPFGMRLMRRCLRGWMHGSRPETTLEFRKHMDAVRRELEGNPRMFEDLLRDVLLENRHRSTVIVRPDPEMNRRELDGKQQWLAERLSAMSDTEKQQLKSENEALERYQNTPDRQEDSEKIPFLDVEDIPKEIESIPTDTRELQGGLPCYVHDLFTNEIVYLDLGFKLDGLSNDELLLLPLFSNVLDECGLPELSYDELQKKISLTLGGFSSHLEANSICGSPEKVKKHLFFRLKTMEKALRPSLELIRDILLSADLSNVRRITDLFKELKNDFISSIVPAGHSFAMLRANRIFSYSDRYDEIWKGLSQFLYLHGLSAESDMHALAEKMDGLRKKLFCRSRLIVNVTAEGKSIKEILKELEGFINLFPEGNFSAAPGEQPDSRGDYSEAEAEAWIVPASVGYVAKSMQSSLLGSKEHAMELILAHILQTSLLWEKIRMRGGAYGAFASTQGLDGTFTFASYRDPNIVNTLKAYRESLAELASSRLSEKDLRPAVIGTVGRELRPFSPGQKGAVAFRRILYGVSDRIRQQKRDWMIAARADGIQEAAHRLSAAYDDTAVCVIGGKEGLEAAAAEFAPLKKNISKLPL